MVYRASNNAPSEILSSIRFEMLRDGIQDYEKLKILQSSLESSSDPYDQEILNELNNIIDNFGKTSGTEAEQLIIQGQKAIEEIVLGTFSYCKVNGETNSDYYVQALSTIGGSNNIVFSTNQYPNTGYEHHITTRVSTLPGDNFTFNLVNSAASNCARTKVWIDWNNDEDFDDSGEEVYSAGVFGSCSNSISYSIPITVPSNLDQGIIRVRIQVRKSDESEPVSCGTNDKTSTVDFDLEILSLYCDVTGTNAYNANAVSTTGGTTNISYAGSAGTNNYEDNTATQEVTVAKGSAINISVTNSNGYSRSIIWVDWNGDNDFDDAGEQLSPLSLEKFYSGVGPIAYAMDIIVPESATIGSSKIRILTGDAWYYNDTIGGGDSDGPGIPVSPCGDFLHAGFKDFSIEITSVLSNNHFEENYDFHIYPNPVKENLFIHFPANNGLITNILIMNNIGQIVYEKSCKSFKSPESIILPTTLKNGMYFLKLTSQNKSFLHKLIRY